LLKWPAPPQTVPAAPACGPDRAGRTTDGPSGRCHAAVPARRAPETPPPRPSGPGGRRRPPGLPGRAGVPESALTGAGRYRRPRAVVQWYATALAGAHAPRDTVGQGRCYGGSTRRPARDRRLRRRTQGAKPTAARPVAVGPPLQRVGPCATTRGRGPERYR